MTGLSLGPRAVCLQPIGTIFINAIHMMVTPVIFTAILCAVLSVNDLKKMRKVSIHAVMIYVACMAVAAIIGVSVASFIKPGASFHPALTAVPTISKAPSFIHIIENIIPRSPIMALANEHVIQIVFFALILGFAIRLSGESAKLVSDFFKAFSVVVFKLAAIIVSFAPYGIFALIAWTFGSFGFQAVIPLIKFVGTVYLGCLLQIIFVYMLTFFLFSKLNPFTFLKAISAAITFAFTTSSSAATLPLSIKCAEKKLGVPPSIARFLLPLGSSFNLNGLSIYLSVAVIFAANIYGIHLSFSGYFTVISTIVLTAMGAAAVPGSALIIMGGVRSSVGIPLGALALIAGVDRLNDMAQTATNVIGDLFSATLVADNEGVLDRKKWQESLDTAQSEVGNNSPIDV